MADFWGFAAYFWRLWAFAGVTAEKQQAPSTAIGRMPRESVLANRYAAGRQQTNWRKRSMPSRGSSWLWIIAAVVGVGGLLLALAGQSPAMVETGDDTAHWLYRLAWAVFAVLALVMAFGRRPAAVLHNLTIWVGLGLVLVVGYSYRDVFDDAGRRLSAEFSPAQGFAEDEHSISFRADADGHFRVEATVDGTAILFLVDTGASDIVLSAADARRLGFDVAHLDYAYTADTANGTVRWASVTLRQVVIGPVRIANPSAAVNQGELEESLLGMSFLSRLDGFSFDGDKLTLRQ